MKFCVKNVIEFIKPIVFLCGPYYKEADYDRRKILKDFFLKDEYIKKKHIIPIIVDTFLDETKINDEEIKIPLMEEICASISMKTYIFLDTFSSVVELGMFSTSKNNNKICVIVPNKDDKLVENINFFVENVYKTNKYINDIKYTPKIIRVPYASDYVMEFYEFPNNKIPLNIRNSILQDLDLSEKSFEFKFVDSHKKPLEFNEIHFNREFENDECYNIIINLKTLFYLVISIIIVDNGENQREDELLEKLNNIFKNTLNLQLKQGSVRTISIETEVNYPIEVVIKHIVKFYSLFNKYGNTSSRKILTKKDIWIKEYENIEYFDLDVMKLATISDYIKNQNKYIDTYNIFKKGKNRKIIKYKDDLCGEKLKKIHKDLLEILIKDHKYSQFSYAYRKGYGTNSCVKKHIDSNSFLKLDIKNFFNSITSEKLYKLFYKHYNGKIGNAKQMKKLVKAFLFNDMVSLGFITSPLISDMYLREFDLNISNIIEEKNLSIKYTRYADDMCFSSNKYIDDQKKRNIIKIVSVELSKINLKINFNKIKLINLNKEGDHFKFLGINIVKTNSDNIITVGKKYIYNTAKMYLKYIKIVNSTEKINENEVLIKLKEKIIGRVAYIKQIEGDRGLEILCDRISKSTDRKIKIIEDELNCLKKS